MHDSLWLSDDLMRRARDAARDATERLRNELPDLSRTSRWPQHVWHRICGERPVWPLVAAVGLSAAALGALFARRYGGDTGAPPGFASLERWEGEGGSVTDDPLPEPKNTGGPSLLRQGQQQLAAHPVMAATAGVVLGGAVVALLLHRRHS